MRGFRTSRCPYFTQRPTPLPEPRQSRSLRAIPAERSSSSTLFSPSSPSRSVSFLLLQPELAPHGIRIRRNSSQESVDGLEPQEADRGVVAPRRDQPGGRAGEVDSARPSINPAPVVGKASARGVPGGAVCAARGRSVCVAGGVPDRRGPSAGARAAARDHRRNGAVGGDSRTTNPEQGAVRNHPLPGPCPRRGAARAP